MQQKFFLSWMIYQYTPFISYLLTTFTTHKISPRPAILKFSMRTDLVIPDENDALVYFSPYFPLWLKWTHLESYYWLSLTFVETLFLDLLPSLLMTLLKLLVVGHMTSHIRWGGGELYVLEKNLSLKQFWD